MPRGTGLSVTPRRSKATDRSELAFPVSEYMRRRLAVAADRRCAVPASSGDYLAAARHADWSPELAPGPTSDVSGPQRPQTTSPLPSPDALGGPDGVPREPTSWVYDEALTIPPRPRLRHIVVDAPE